jgi:phage terminase large subunit-like protein
VTYSPKAQSYIDGVLAGSIVVCANVRLAVERARQDLDRENDPAWPFQFDSKKAERVCKFTELLCHIQGPKGGMRIALEPWQRFILETLFGWVWKDSGTRRFRRGYLHLPKGSGKTLLASAIALYLMCADGEEGADCVATATTLTQAKLVLDTARMMVLKDKVLQEKFGLRVRHSDVLQDRTNSRLRGLPAKGSSIEGIALHCAIVDELHAAKSRAMWDNLRTAASKRPQAMMLGISTAGDDISGIGYEVFSYVEALLNRRKDDAEFFGILYGIDPEDDWRSEDALRKANPNFGVSVDAKGVRAELNRALQLPSNEAAYRTKHLNEWLGTGGEEPFLPLDKVRKCYDPNLADDFTTAACAVGMDLASRLDLCAVARVHSKKIEDKTHYFAFVKAWLPAATLAKSQNASYQGWLRQGFLSETPGSVTDLEVIEAHIQELFGLYTVRDVSFDPLQSNYLITRLQKENPDKTDVFVEFGQYAKHFTPGMVELETAVADGRLHTNSPLLVWCLSNLRAKRGGNNLVYPSRPKDIALKIDAAVALAMALRSTATTPLDETPVSIYETRGILTI